MLVLQFSQKINKKKTEIHSVFFLCIPIINNCMELQQKSHARQKTGYFFVEDFMNKSSYFYGFSFTLSERLWIYRSLTFLKIFSLNLGKMDGYSSLMCSCPYCTKLLNCFIFKFLNGLIGAGLDFIEQNTVNYRANLNLVEFFYKQIIKYHKNH